MKIYKSQKVVAAAPIVSIESMGGFYEIVIDGDYEGESKVEVLSDFCARFQPSPGDYLVQYENGHLSASPKDEFESNYSRMELSYDHTA